MEEHNEGPHRKLMKLSNGEQAAPSIIDNTKAMCISSALSVLPDIDTNFLENVWLDANGNVLKFNEFISKYMDSKDYVKAKKKDTTPTNYDVTEYNELWTFYVTNFTVESFLKAIGSNPNDLFLKCLGNGKNADDDTMQNIIKFFKERYPRGMDQTFYRYLHDNKYCLLKTSDALNKHYKTINPNGILVFRHSFIEEPLLQKLVFLTKKKEIDDYLATKNENREKNLRNLPESEILECQCCYDRIMIQESAFCPKGHSFCFGCVIKSCEIKIAENDVAKITCMTECDQHFSEFELKHVLPRLMYKNLLTKRQLVEVESAKIDGLESCPFCSYSCIPPANEKIFRCLNAECLKETCRECKLEAHVPLTCEEAAKLKSNTSYRTRVEESMSEALFRVCFKCFRKFIKIDGCNKMTCVCGAIQCYVCRAVNVDYNHFNDQQTPNPKDKKRVKCPLFVNNKVFDVNAVKDAEQNAKAELLKENPLLAYTGLPNINESS